MYGSTRGQLQPDSYTRLLLAVLLRRRLSCIYSGQDTRHEINPFASTLRPFYDVYVVASR